MCKYSTIVVYGVCCCCLREAFHVSEIFARDLFCIPRGKKKKKKYVRGEIVTKETPSIFLFFFPPLSPHKYECSSIYTTVLYDTVLYNYIC